MALPDNVQTLSAAFTFGILLQAATGALFLYYQGRGPSLLKDGRRLVLLLFLLFAAFWAQFSFISLLLPITTSSGCQALLVFTTLFDQLARVGFEQFLVWGVGQGTKATTLQLILQGILGVRLIAGGLLVGFARPDFAPTCIARTSVLSISIVVLVLDVIIIGVSVIRASSLGFFSEMSSGKSGTKRDQARALIFGVGGFTAWTGTSVPLILEIQSIILIVRTVVPAVGLLALVGVVTIFQGALLLQREEEGTTPEARSPFVTPPPPATRELFRENIDNGSPVSGHNYTKSGTLFVVNPSVTPSVSPITRLQGNWQADVRPPTKLAMETSVRDLGVTDQTSQNGPGYRGSSGVFPSGYPAPLQAGGPAAAFPLSKPVGIEGVKNVPILAVPAPTSQQKRWLFSKVKTPEKQTVRTLGISKPIMNERDESVQPFARMPTIDLATAAINERERREEAAARSRLIADRPAPQPPSRPPAIEGLRRSISVKRKEMPSIPKAPMPTIAGSEGSGLSVHEANGISTSASLSPGRDEIRRRSPRNMNNFNHLIVEKPRTVVPLQSNPPPLQRTGTIGLPSNPRAQRITMVREAGMAKEQTVMLMNNIVYDNPGIVNTIISAAPAIYEHQRPKTAGKRLENTSLPSPTQSIIHRPRPIKREAEKDRVIFPSEPSPLHAHRRSKSANSLLGRRPIFASTPGSPDKLPPLPPPPTSASKLKRLIPNNTTSMTFDEKIELLFPAPPGAPSIRDRRSSVPSLPRVPSVFIADTPQMQSPSSNARQSQRASKRTTIASFVMPDLERQPNLARAEPIKAPEQQTYRYSAGTYRTLADEVGETWMPGISPANVDVRNSIRIPAMPEREPVPDRRQKSTWTETNTSAPSSSDDATTYWGSIHSEIPPIDLSKARTTEKATLIQTRAPESSSKNPLPRPVTEFNDGEEIMTVMLDTKAEARQPILSQPQVNRRSFLLNPEEFLPGDNNPSPKSSRIWHRRIGDQLPTFSERKEKARARKMPPPTPLLLNKKGKQATEIVRNTEPSPIDSPELAMQQLQAQLKRFEDPERGSMGSIIRRLPMEENQASDDRLELLADLEKEMGQQENQWQRMQSTLDRDSVSIVMSPAGPSPPPKTDASRTSSQRASRTPQRVLSRRERFRSGVTVRSKGDDSTCTTSTQSSDNSRASIWQQRLAEAQEEYLEKAPALLRKQSLNFLSVVKSHQLGSPTPPDSGESETDLELDSEAGSPNVEKVPAITKIPLDKFPKLWNPSKTSSEEPLLGQLWTARHTAAKATRSPDPPAKDVRPVQRITTLPLTIESSNLWTKPRSAQHSRPVIGMWGSRPSRPRSIVTRPLTQKPARRSKRVTFLPDIVESPEPLPNKRDTLGIFQFPWGEKSDSATYQPAFNPALLAGPIINTNLDARSRQLEPDSSEYSSSFFDDYDEELDDVVDPESDDDFDETTLWEIASLLNSRDVPSKHSLLPPAIPQEIIEDYDDETDPESENDSDSSVLKVQAPMTRLPIQPLAPAPRERSQLWENSTFDIPTTTSVVGMTQPSEEVWSALVGTTKDTLRAKPRASAILPTLATNKLWTFPSSEFLATPNDAMWSIQTLPDREPLSLTLDDLPNELLWRPMLTATPNRHSGLFTVRDRKTVIRSTDATPAAIHLVKAARPSSQALTTLTSRALWSLELPAKQATEWTFVPLSPVQGDRVSNFLMWQPKEMKVEETTSGLFNVAVLRSDYRRTSLTPAAIDMICKPRTSAAQMSRLTSNKLWTCTGSLLIEHDWISESSIRPDSPTISSVSSSGQSSPTSDSSSVKSTSTKASSIWSSVSSTTNASISSWFGAKPAKKSSLDELRNVSKGTGRQSSIKRLSSVFENVQDSKIPTPTKETAPVRKLRALFPRDSADAKDLTMKSVPASSPVHRPLRHQYRPVYAFRADWDEALAEAVAAGTRGTNLKRLVVSQADWAAALSIAISRSQPKPHRLLARSEGWATALAEAVSKSSIPSRTAKYDPSIMHPVFFTNKLIARTSQIHPAAIGHISSQATAPLMWNNNAYIAAPKARALWTKETAARREAIPAVDPFTEVVRKAIVTRTAELPVLESTSLWEPIQALAVERNWLSPTKSNACGTWAVPKDRPLLDKSSKKQMWSTRTPEPAVQPDMFANQSHFVVKKAPTARPSTLSRLESSELFEVQSVSDSITHWLHDAASKLPKRVSDLPAASECLIQGLLWTPSDATRQVDDSNEGMWACSQSERETQAPSLFSNPHAAPWEQKKRPIAPLKDIVSTSMWRPSMAVPLSPKNWLVKRRFARVEFRY